MSSAVQRRSKSTLTWPVPLAAMAPAQRNFTLALAASLFIHAIVLSIHFHLPQALLRNTENALDVVLVNSKHAHKPKDAQVYAQSNLDGGGESEQDQRATTFLPPTTATRDGNDVVETQRRVEQLESEQKQLMTRLKANVVVQAAKPQQEAPSAPQPPVVSGIDLASRALAVARLQAQIERQMNEYNKRPRVKNIGIRAEEVRYAQYVEDWRQKIERIGNLNYPDAAKGRWYGSLTLTVTLLNSGEVKEIEINRSSGVPVLDEAAKRIVRMSAPYAAFPENIRREYDELTITRKWTFTREDQLQTQ